MADARSETLVWIWRHRGSAGAGLLTTRSVDMLAGSSTSTLSTFSSHNCQSRRRPGSAASKAPLFSLVRSSEPGCGRQALIASHRASGPRSLPRIGPTSSALQARARKDSFIHLHEPNRAILCHAIFKQWFFLNSVEPFDNCS
jgi:hypothetical protein